MADSFYITTSIFYPNAEPHIGSAFEVIGADVAARYHRLCGEQVLYQTGLDEHGEKVQKRAEDRGMTPQEHVDEMAVKFRNAFEALEISNDNFVRTTDQEHKDVVAEVFRRSHENGDIYKGHYTGWYCSGCERFFPATQLNEDKTCPTHNRPLQELNEDAYFFKLDEYGDKLLDYYEKNPHFIRPETRLNEMRNFVKQGLEPLCISRTSIHWGIPLPIDTDHVIYVWFDALINYLTGIGFGTDEATFNKWWSNTTHIVGKDVVRFHTIIWPAMLMSAGIDIPHQVVGHGFVNLRISTEDGSEQEVKISKSSILNVNAQDVAQQYGADAVRYFLMREVPFVSDGLYSEDAMIGRFNTDLANDLGNLLHRTLSMIDKYNDGVVPQADAPEQLDTELQNLAADVLDRVDPLIRNFQLKEALEAIWELVTTTNVYIEKNQPWKLAKGPELAGRLNTVLYHMAEAIRIVAVLVQPYIPTSANKMAEQLGLTDYPGTLPEAAGWGRLAAGTKTNKGQPVFPRIEVEKE